MDFRIPEELEGIRATTRQFVEERVNPLAPQIEDEDEIPKSLLEEAKGLGLFGLAIPEEYGGIGLSMLGRCLVYEEMGRGPAGFSSVIGAHTSIGTVGIVAHGTPEQKAWYLPKIAAGEWIAAFALSEPGAGSDAAAITTRAARKGDRYILNGMKHFITNGPIADVLTVIAVTDPARGHRGISSFLVEKRSPGFRVGPIERTMGLRGSHISQLFFEECEVPAGNLLGGEGEGFGNAMRILTDGRAGMAARCVGTCEKLIELAGRYAKQRVQFGKPIAEFQAIQLMLADMAAETEAARWLTYRVAWMVDQGMPVPKEAPMAKLIATETLGRVVDRALQIHGGYGFTKAFPIERFYRDARITRIYEGTSEIQRLIIAERVLKDLG